MSKFLYKITPAALFVLFSIALSSCSASTEPNAAKSKNANQTTAITAPPIENNANLPVADNLTGGNTVSVNPSNPASPTGNKNAAKPAPPVKEPTPVVGSGGSDFALFNQARGALDAADAAFVNGVIIDIKEGNAILTGGVASEAQKKKAEDIVRSVKGIKSVKNNLRVS